VRDSVALEQLGIPTLTLVTTSFERLARATSTGLGMPDQSFVIIPHPMGGIPAEQVRTRIQRAFADLQRDLVEWRPAHANVRRDAPKVERSISMVGSVSDVHAEFRRRGWSAGLPFVPPTRDLVDAILRGTSHAPDEVVWDGVPPRMGVLTVEGVAACAAMAGGEPRHLPVLLAIVEALQDPLAWYAHQATTTGTESLMLLVDGPIADELGLASGTGAAGLWFQPNAAIGYAIGLISKIVGGSKPPHRDKSTLASPPDLLNWAIAENERENPWQSLAVEHGLSASDDVVTVKVVYPPIDINDHQSSTAAELLNYIAHCINQPYVYAMRDAPVLLGLCPEHAATLASDGETKESIRQYLWQHARYPASVYARPAWDAGAVKPNAAFPDIRFGSDTPLPIVARADNFEIIVCGGAGKHSHFWPGPKGIVSRCIAPWR
jgi:hypothetical protein